MIQILQLLGALSLMVIIHEFGHFIAAKACGVRVEKFYLFFNPGFTLFKFKPKNSETEYGVGWLPLGGYVKLAGMIDESLDTEQMKHPAQPWEFRSKPAWKRLIIMAAGVIMNFLTAVVVYAMLTFSQGDNYVALQDVQYGMEYSAVAHQYGFVDGDRLYSADGKVFRSYDYDAMRAILEAKEVTVLRTRPAADAPEGIALAVDTISLPLGENFKMDLVASQKGFADYRLPFVVREVMPMSPAEQAKLQAGDSLVSIAGVLTPTMTEARKVLHQSVLTEIPVEYYRKGQLCSTVVRPDSAGNVGVYLSPYFEIYPIQHTSYGFFESFPVGVQKGYRMFADYADDFKLVFTKVGAESIGGFGSMAKLFDNSFSAVYFWNIVAYLSVILAFMNLLPIPGLDGGHIFFLIIECIRRKPLSQTFMLNAQKVGLFLLLFLLLYANGMDIVRWLS